MTDIRSHLEAHFAKWRLTPDGEPFETHSSWLAYVARDKVRGVLKVFKPGSDEAPGARYLAAHHGSGTVQVLEADEAAIVLERIVPGTTLTELSLSGRDDEATHIVCDVIEKLQRAHAPAAGFAAHEDQKAEFERRIAIPPLTADIAARARTRFDELEATQASTVLLHGDLHHDNILFDAERGWLAIDPKGIVADLAYEIAAPLRNPYQRSAEFLTPEAMDRRVAIYCERLGLERRRVLSWCFARNCVAALWYADRTPVPERTKAWPLATLSAMALLDC
ncbi:MAG: phosphotransferase [Proteobacteria bacterium]|nr:phosphotransferase [Pseudomonadota bacterium]